MALFGPHVIGPGDPASVNDSAARMKPGAMIELVQDGSATLGGSVLYQYMKNGEALAAWTANLGVKHSTTQANIGIEVLNAATTDAGKAVFAGLAANAVGAGKFGFVARRGVFSYVADGAVAVGDRLTLGGTTAGRLKKATPEGDLAATVSADYIVAKALEAAAVGQTKKCELI